MNIIQIYSLNIYLPMIYFRLKFTAIKKKLSFLRNWNVGDIYCPDK
jgi:hypothetical protein